MRAWSWKSSVVFAQWRQRNVPKSLIAHCNCFVDWSSLKYRGRRGGGGYVLSPIRGNSAQKGYFFQASGIWKGGEIAHFGRKRDKKGKQVHFMAVKKSKNVLVLWFIQSSELDIRKGWHWFNRRYTKEVLFLSKKQIKGSSIGPRGGASLFGVSVRVSLSLS